MQSSIYNDISIYDHVYIYIYIHHHVCAKYAANDALGIVLLNYFGQNLVKSRTKDQIDKKRANKRSFFRRRKLFSLFYCFKRKLLTILL